MINDILLKVMGVLCIAGAVILVILFIIDMISLISDIKNHKPHNKHFTFYMAIVIGIVVMIPTGISFINIKSTKTTYNNFIINEYTVTVQRWGKSYPEERYKVDIGDGKTYILKTDSTDTGNTCEITVYGRDAGIFNNFRIDNMDTYDLTLSEEIKWELKNGNTVVITNGR